jgi:hypothetical protein
VYEQFNATVTTDVDDPGTSQITILNRAFTADSR